MLLAALLCASACDGHRSDMGEGSGDIILNISNPAGPLTKHSDGEGSDAGDGGVMKTLGVWLVTNGGPKTEGGNGDGVYKIMHRAISAPDAATHTVEFTDVARGSYYLIIVANYTSTTADVSGYTVGSSVPSGFKTALVTAEIDGSAVSVLTDGQSPSFNDVEGMPSSYEKVISVAAGKNVINASLKRCVGRLTFNLRNNLDDYEVFVHSMSLSKYNKSQGYVFGSVDNSSIPYVAFPDLPDMDQDGDGVKDGLVQVAPRAYKNIYDIYLYETNPGDSIKFDMLAALYPKGTQKSAVTVNSRTQDPYELQGNTTSFSSGGQYLIRSALSDTYYLGDTGSSGSGNLVATSLTSDYDIKVLSDITRYFWKFSASTGSSTSIQNVATGNYLTVSASSASLSGTEASVSSTTASNNSVVRFYTSSITGWWNYYLSFDGSRIFVDVSSSEKSTKNWYVRPIITGTGDTVYYFENPYKEIPRNYRPIKYIDSYGASQLLTKIDRNEHVTVNINVFYNRELGQFDFEVLDWDDGGDRETTFD